MATQKRNSPGKSRTGGSPNGARLRNGSSPRSPRRQASGGKRNGTKGAANPKANFDRYIALAQTAAANGDEVEAEGHYQHAEHFYRLMNSEPV